MNRIRVSILTPVYLGEAYVAESIESALSQTYPYFEIIVVNDGSPGNCRELVRPFLSDSRVRYVEKENGGVASARNAALAVAVGEFIGFLDQDDLWLPDKLEKQVRFLDAHPECAFVHARQLYIDSSNRPIDREFINIEPIRGDCFSLLFERNRIGVLTVLARKHAVEEAGGFNVSSSGADDYEVWLRISFRRLVGFIDEPVAAYRVHDCNASHDPIKTTEADLAVIESVCRSLPNIEEKISRELIRKRRFKLHWELGGWYSWQERNISEARRHLRAAVLIRPLSLMVWTNLLWFSLTKQMRRQFSWWRRKLTKV